MRRYVPDSISSRRPEAIVICRLHTLPDSLRRREGGLHAAESADTYDAAAHASAHVGHAAERWVLQAPILILHILHVEGLRQDLLLLLVSFEDFAQVFEALFAVFVQILNQLFLFDDLRHLLTEGQLGAGVFGQSVVAFDDVFEESGARLILNLRDHHVIEHRRYGIKPLGGLAQVIQSGVVEENLLNDECGDGLAELGTPFHDPKAQRYYLSLQQEADDFCVVYFHEGADNAQRCKT